MKAGALCYIAGAYRARTAWGIHANIVEAEAAAVDVADLGLFPVTPHKLGEHMDGRFPDEFWLAGTMELMRRCDLVYVYSPIDEYQSDGTKAEVAEARRLGKPVLVGYQALTDFMEAA